MARRKHRMVPTEQMDPDDPITQELPLGSPDAQTPQDEGKGYWDRALGRKPARRSIANQPAPIRTVSVHNDQGPIGEPAPAADEANSYWDRARGAAPRRPQSPVRPAVTQPPAAVISVTPGAAQALHATSEDPVVVPTVLAASEPARVPTETLAAVESEASVRGAHVRRDDALVTGVRGAHVKAEDPLADAAWHTHLAEDDALSVEVCGAHVMAEEDPLAGEVQAALGLQAVAPLDERVDPQPTEAVTESEVLAAEAPEAAETHKPASHRSPGKSRRRHWRLVPMAGAGAALAVGLGAGGAYAYFASTGSGTGHATTGSPVTVIATATSGTADLLPGGSGAASFTLNNTNPFAVTFKQVTSAGVVSNNTIACPSANVSIAETIPFTFSPTITVSGGGTSGTETIAHLVKLAATAPSSCQGITFTVTFTLSGSSS